MKRFYTVKEASEILGFSTNTVYKYLDEGKLKGVRIGQGRFKIPKEVLAPYLSTAEKVESVVQQEVIGEKIALAKAAETIDEAVEKGSGDFVFFRLFSGFLMLGAGVIYLIWRENLVQLFPYSSYFVSLGLILSGALALYGAINWRKNPRLDLVGHIFSILVLAIASLVALLSSHFGAFILFVSLSVVSITQVVRGLKYCYENT